MGMFSPHISIQMREQLQGRRDIVQPFEHTMASNTSRYCSQFDFPEYRGTGVDVNPDRLGGRRATAGACFLASSTRCGSRQNISVVVSPPFLIQYSANPVPLSHLHLVFIWKSVFPNTLPPEAYLHGSPQCHYQTSYYQARRT